MRTANPTATELLNSIQDHCIKCAGSIDKVAKCDRERCKFHKYRVRELQIDLFSAYRKDTWTALAKEVLLTMGESFYWSEYRLAVEKQCKGAAHKNWWGLLAMIARKAGYIKTQMYQRNPIEKCRGSEDYLWYRT